MTNYELIEEIRLQSGLNISDFLDVTDISRGTYYSLKRGETTTVQTGTMNKLRKIYPNFDYSRFNTFSNYSVQDKDYQHQLSQIPAYEILLHLTQNRKERFDNEPLFKAFKTILNQEYELEVLKEKYADLEPKNHN